MKPLPVLLAAVTVAACAAGRDPATLILTYKEYASLRHETPYVLEFAVGDVDYLRSDEKYTRVAWREDGSLADGLIRTPLKDLAAQLDPAQFMQVHRSVLVNRRAISHVKRGDNETATIHLKGRQEVLPVSRSYLHLFQHM